MVNELYLFLFFSNLNILVFFQGLYLWLESFTELTHIIHQVLEQIFAFFFKSIP